MLQGFGHHHRPQIRTADTDVNHRLDTLAGVAGPGAVAYRVTPGRHLIQHCPDARHHIDAVNHDRLVGDIPQRSVQDGPLLGGIDGLTRKHSIAPGFDLAVAGQCQ